MNARKILLTSLLISVMILLVVNLTFGTYFEGYEAIVNALVGGEFSSQMDFSFFVPGWFCVFPIFSFFTFHFNTPFVYGWANTLVNVAILTAFTSYFIFMVKSGSLKLWHGVLLYFLLLLIFTDSLVHVYNLRLTFFGIIAALLYFHAIQKFVLSKWNYLFVFLLVATAILSRLEIAVAVSVIVLAFSILLYRKALRFSVVVFGASVFVFLFYKTFQHFAFPDTETVLQTEQEFEDRASISPQDFKDKRSQLIVTAMSQYIEDDEIYGVSDYAKLMCGKSLTEYVRSDKFPAFYMQKLSDLLDELAVYVWLFFLTAAIVFYTTYNYVKSQARWGIGLIKVFLFFMFLLAIVFSLNVISFVPYNFVSVILSSCCLLCIFYLSENLRKTRGVKLFLVIFLIAHVLFLDKHLHNVYKLEGARCAKAKVFRALLVNLNNQHKQIVFSTGSHFDNYPSRLFTGILEPRINHYYAEFFLSRYKFFQKHNRDFFGPRYSFMRNKIAHIADNKDVVYVSNDKYNGFIKEYVHFFYGIDLQFIPYKTEVALDDLKPYTVHIADDKPAG